MTFSIAAYLGIASAVVNAIAFIPYVRSILKGKAKPERSTWWIWASLMAVSLVAQLSAGATWSALLTAVFLVGNTIIAYLSLTHGYGKFDAKDVCAIAAAGIGIVLWRVTGDPLIALVMTIGVDFLASLLTIAKSWRAPYSENLTAWMLMTIAAVLSMLSVGSFNVVVLLFPAYVTIVNVLTISSITYRRNWRSNRIKAGRLRRKR